VSEALDHAQAIFGFVGVGTVSERQFDHVRHAVVLDLTLDEALRRAVVVDEAAPEGGLCRRPRGPWVSAAGTTSASREQPPRRAVAFGEFGRRLPLGDAKPSADVVDLGGPGEAAKLADEIAHAQVGGPVILGVRDIGRDQALEALAVVPVG
jgi:hypothetical protein